MNNVIWAIQTNLINDDTVKAVWDSAQRIGCDTREAIVIPFQDELGNEAELEALDSENNVIIPYGSVKLAKMSERRNWRGNCYVPATFRADVWNLMRDDMLNGDCAVMQVKDTEKFFEGVDEDEQWFIRPVQDLKEFNGTVAQVGDIKSWMNSPKSGNFSFGEETGIILAPVKKLYSEERWFIVGGKVVSGAVYRMGGRLVSSQILAEENVAHAQEFADKWLPHPCCVMDLADTDEGGKVIEFNTINSSGFYGHDISKIVQAMTRWAQNLT
jgi:hypothetical protein